MNESVTVRDVMNREYVGVSEGDPVDGAAELMREEGVNSAVVLRGQEPVGMLSAGDIVAVVADGLDPADISVGDAMAHPVTSIDADHRLSEAVGAIANRDVRRLVVVANGEVVGVLSEHDIVAAHAALPASLDDQDVAAGDIDAAPPTAVEREVYSSQGVCEICGSLVRNLTSHNGQLVCDDCIGM